jgi:conjugal transfer pilus assembly protein TraK
MMLSLPLALGGTGACSLSCAYARRYDVVLRWIGYGLIGAAVALSSRPALADQYKIAADNARVDCTVSRHELTRISLVGDQIAAVSKVSSGGPYNDFSVVNEPIRGDIYVAVPDSYAPKSISFFAISKKGFVYKFACGIEAVEAQQIFVTNPGLATEKAAAWESQTNIEDTALRLIQAMASEGSVDGYEIRQPANSTAKVGDLAIRLIAEYRGAALDGKVLRIENKSAAPVLLNETDLAPIGTLAVTITQPSLAPGQATAAYLVGQNGGQ